MEEYGLESLRPAEYNPRTLSKHDYASLKKSIQEFGDISGVIKNLTTGNLVGGHQRVKIFAELPSPKIIITQRLETPNSKGSIAWGYVVIGDERWAYREVMWALDFEQAANVAANRIQGEWDDQALAELIYSMDDDMRKLTGHTEDEINRILGLVSDNGKEPDLADKFEVVVECTNESEQQQVYDRLQAEGLTCRVLTL